MASWNCEIRCHVFCLAFIGINRAIVNSGRDTLYMSCGLASAHVARDQIADGTEDALGSSACWMLVGGQDVGPEIAG